MPIEAEAIFFKEQHDKWKSEVFWIAFKIVLSFR